MKVSVIIAAYNAGNTIQLCLDALHHQSFPKDEYEIIVVDDGSTDHTAEIVKRYKDVRFLTQPNQGPAVARNRGAREASGEFLLFTDSDCEPEYDWIEEMCKPFENDEEAIGVKGFYRTKQSEISARFAQIEYENKYDLMKKEKQIDFIDTYSAAYRRTVFLKYGGFDSTYTTASGEDSEFSYRLSNMGYKMLANFSAIVYHKHPNTIVKYLKKKFRNAYWRWVTWKKHPHKVVKDSHTPNSLKFQVLLCGLIILSAILIPIEKLFVYPLLSASILFILTTLSFTVKAVKKDLIVGILSPPILFFRSVAFVLGVIASIINRN